MHSENFIYTDKIELKSWLTKQSKDKDTTDSILVQIFDGSLNKNQVTEVAQTIKASIPSAIILGVSSCGEVANGKMYEFTTLISLTSFENTSLISFNSQDVADEAGKVMANTLVQDDTQCIILFVDGLDYDVDTLLESFHKSGGQDILVVGGVSGDNYTFDSSSFVLADTKVFTQGIVAVSLNNVDLECFNAHNYAWKSIGKNMLITKADKNCVYEIDGQPSALVYARYLGEDVLSDTSQSLLEFPLSYEDEGVPLSRSVLRVNSDNSIELSGQIKEGTTVRFAVEDESGIIDSTADIYVKASIKPIESMFTYSCAARKSFFNNHLEAEYKALSQISTQAGFITYGEFAYAKGKNRLFNGTSVVLGLSESKKINNRFKTNLLHPKHIRKSVKAISHLMEVTTQELNDELSVGRKLTHLLKQYQDALDTAALVSKTDERGVITYSNDKFCELSGYKQEELIGHSHNIVRHSETPKTVFEDMWRKLKAKEIWSGMLQNRKKDGSSYYVHATIIPILDQEENICEYMAIREDLTSLILYEKGLQMQTQRLHQILDNQESIVALTTKEGEVSFLNKKFFDAFSYTDLGDFLSQHKCLCELYVNEDGGYKGCDIDCNHDIYETESAPLIQQEHMLDKESNVLTFRIETKKILIDKKTMCISTLSDITEIENARIKAEETKNIKADFLANMSHEVRTPMNGIIGFSGLLSESVLNEEQRQYIEVIQHSAKMLLGVVDGILDFSKLEQGKMKLNVKEINLFKEMELLYMNYLLSTKEKNLIYTLEVDPKIQENLIVDELHLKQVLSNLINNAVKFTSEDEKISIRASLMKDAPSSQQIEFSVEDTGIGIAALRQKNIFEAFAQEDTSTTREFGGTGLGLSISASLIKLMGSEIKLESEKDKGSRFSFIVTLDKGKIEKNLGELIHDKQIYISENVQKNVKVNEYLEAFNIRTPLYAEDSLEAKEPGIYIVFDEKEALTIHNNIQNSEVLVVCIDAQSDSQSEFSNLQFINCYQRCSTRLYTILSQYGEQLISSSKAIEVFDGSQLCVLVAEDNEVNQMLITELLKKYKISVQVVSDGAQAVEYCKQEKYDLILMDINMPVLNGLDATKQVLRGDSKNQMTPIVALTSNVLNEDVLQFKEAGMYAHIAKPIKNSDLHDLLIELFTSTKLNTRQKMSTQEINKSLEKAGELLELPADIMNSLFEKFLVTTQKVIDRMNEAHEVKDYEGLYEQAHKLKGASSSLCFQKITDIAILIEDTIKYKRKSDLSHEIEQLELFLENIKAHKKED